MARQPLCCVWVRVAAEIGALGAAVLLLFYISVASRRQFTTSSSTISVLSPVPVWKRDILSLLSRRQPDRPWVYGAPTSWPVLETQGGSIDDRVTAWCCNLSSNESAVSSRAAE